MIIGQPVFRSKIADVRCDLSYGNDNALSPIIASEGSICYDGEDAITIDVVGDPSPGVSIVSGLEIDDASRYRLVMDGFVLRYDQESKSLRYYEEAAGHGDDWIPWFGSSFPSESGNYYLTTDGPNDPSFMFKGPVSIPSGVEIKLCLSGKQVYFSGGDFSQEAFDLEVPQGSNLTLCGCEEGSYLDANIEVSPDSTLSLIQVGGTVDVRVSEGGVLNVEGASSQYGGPSIENQGKVRACNASFEEVVNTSTGDIVVENTELHSLENFGKADLGLSRFGGYTLTNRGDGVSKIKEIRDIAVSIVNKENATVYIEGPIVSSSSTVLRNEDSGTVVLSEGGSITAKTLKSENYYPPVGISNGDDGKIVVQGGEIDVSRNDEDGAMPTSYKDGAAISMNGGSLSVESGTLKGSAYGVDAGSGAQISMSGGVVSGVCGILCSSYGYDSEPTTFKMSSGEVKGEESGIETSGSGDLKPVVAISGGRVSGKEGIAAELEWPNGIVIMTGGEVVATNPSHAAIEAALVKVGGEPKITTDSSDIWVRYVSQDVQSGIEAQAENADGQLVPYEGDHLTIKEPSNVSTLLGLPLVRSVTESSASLFDMRDGANCRLVFHEEDGTMRLAPVDVEAIEVALSDTTVKVGELITYTTKVFPENATNQFVSVSSVSTNNVLELLGNNTLLAKNSGTATVTFWASGDSSIKKTFDITVLPKDGDGGDGGDEGSDGDGDGDGGNTGGDGGDTGGNTGGGGGGALPPEDAEDEVIDNPDGSVTTIVTNEDGSKTETTVSEDGFVTTVVEKSESGKVVSISAEVTDKAVQESGDAAVVLPMKPVGAATASKDAVEIKVDAPEGAKIAIPVSNESGSDSVASGAVIVMVNPDGTETVLPKTANKGDSLAVQVSGDCVLKVVNASTPFPDVKYGSGGDWFADWADFVVSRGILYGSVAADGSVVFDGGAPTTRGMFVTMLNRLELCPKAASAGSFGDIPEGVYYANPAVWGAENGIVYGVSEGAFDGEGRVTREQMALFMMRYADMLGIDTSARANADTGASSWAKEAMSWAVAEGLLVGDGQSFNPQAGATRAEVAAIVARFVNSLA